MGLPWSMDKILDRLKLLRELGYGHPDAAEAALAVLYAAGLTNPRKTSIAASKAGRAREALEAALARRCARCASLSPPDGRVPVPVDDPARCDVCGGSANRLAVRRATEACRRAGLRRILVVGGAPGVHTALRDLWPEDPELRIVEGTERHTRTDAVANLAWADVVLLWAPTALAHRVSELYTRPARAHVIPVHRRGIEALADVLAEHAAGR